MNDDHATAAIEAALDLACTIRDEGPDAVRRATARLVATCQGDTGAALAVLAALIDVNRPVDAWWQRGLDGLGFKEPTRGLEPCGTHAAFNRHKDHGEMPCDACVVAEGAYQAARPGRRAA